MYTLTIDTAEPLGEQLEPLSSTPYSRLVVNGRITARVARAIANAAIENVEELYVGRFDDDPDAIDDEVSQALLEGDWRSLRRVDLAHNPCGPATIAALTKLPALEDVGLPLTTTRDDIAALVDAPRACRLQRLDISNTGVGDAGVHAIARANLTALRVLRLSTTSASMEALAALAASPHLTHLEELSYGWPRAGNELVAALAGDHSRLDLRRLDLATVRLDDGSTKRLVAKMRNLEQLQLAVCTLDASAFEALSQLASLRDVALVQSLLDDRATQASTKLGSRIRNR